MLSKTCIICVIFCLYLQIFLFRLLHIIAQRSAINQKLFRSMREVIFSVSQPLLIISTNVTSNDTRNILIRQYIRNVIPVNDNE